MLLTRGALVKVREGLSLVRRGLSLLSRYDYDMYGNVLYFVVERSSFPQEAIKIIGQERANIGQERACIGQEMAVIGQDRRGLVFSRRGLLLTWQI